MLGIAGAVLFGLAVFFVVYITQTSAESNAAKNRLGVDWGSTEKPFRAPFYIALTRPLLKGGTLDLAVGLFKPQTLESWNRKLRAAGLHRNIQAEHALASKFYLSLFVFVFLFLHHLFSADPTPLHYVLGATVLAFFAPDLHINSAKTTRQNEIRLGMPYVMDLMTLSMEAGLEFQGAISRVVERAPPGPFIEELQEVLRMIQLGKSRAESLRSMANAVDIPEITSLSAILISTDQVGAPIGPVLRAQSESMRLERLVKAEKMGAQASQKMLFPLIFFIMPAVFLIIFGPIILQVLGVR